MRSTPEAFRRSLRRSGTSDRRLAMLGQGDLPTEADATDLARYISAILQGMAVQAAGGASREQLARLRR
jgi:hypothetical protein